MPPSRHSPAVDAWASLGFDETGSVLRGRASNIGDSVARLDPGLSISMLVAKQWPFPRRQCVPGEGNWPPAAIFVSQIDMTLESLLCTPYNRIRIQCASSDVALEYGVCRLLSAPSPSIVTISYETLC